MSCPSCGGEDAAAGGVSLHVTIDTEERQIVLHFGGRACAWVAFDASAGRELAGMLIERAVIVEGLVAAAVGAAH